MSGANAEVRTCRSRADVEAASGGPARVVGDYVEVDLRQKPKPPPRYLGRAGLRLEDGTLVLLEPGWSQAGLRSPEERRRFAGKRVEATGTIWIEPPRPATPVAYPIMPCLAPVEALAVVGEGAG